MATPARSVQARDPESVIAFYNNRGVPAFSIRQGNQLIFAYEGESLEDGSVELAEFVEMFVMKPRSAAIYTLCVHTGLKGAAISNKTEYNGSINFRMFDYSDTYGNTGNNYGNNSVSIPAALESKINGIALGLAEVQKQMKGQPPEKGEPESKLGMVGEILDHPLGFAIGRALIEKLLPGAKVPEPQLTQVSGTTGTLEEQHRKLNEALIVLVKADENFPLYLSALADLSVNEPEKFKGFVNMVRMFF